MSSVRPSNLECTWIVGRALRKLEMLSAAPRASLTLPSCSPNYPRASREAYFIFTRMPKYTTEELSSYVKTGIHMNRNEI